MAITDKELRKAKGSERKQSISCGEGLVLVVEKINPKTQNATKRFIGRTRFPSGREGKQIEISIGVYKQGQQGVWTLATAREEWRRLKRLSKERSVDPRVIQDEENVQDFYATQKIPTLKETAEKWLERYSTQWSKATIVDYKNKVYNQILPFLDGSKPVNAFSVSRGGRMTLISLKESIENRGRLDSADKVFMVCRQIFEFANDFGWIQGDNPAKSTRMTRKVKKRKRNHPHLKWAELPLLFELLEENRPNANPIVLSAVKLAFLTFQRVNTLVQMEFGEIDYKKGVWVIPRHKNKVKTEDHFVPLTDSIITIVDQMKEINGHQKYVLFSNRGNQNPYLRSESINAHIIKLGYQGRQTAHGIRSIVLTEGIQELGHNKDLIRRQMGHIVGTETERSYLHAEFREERQKFMDDWCSALIDQGLKV